MFSVEKLLPLWQISDAVTVSVVFVQQDDSGHMELLDFLSRTDLNILELLYKIEPRLMMNAASGHIDFLKD